MAKPTRIIRVGRAPRGLGSDEKNVPRTINLHRLGDGIRPRLVGTVQPKRSANLSDILHLSLENRVLTFTGVITHDADDAPLGICSVV